MVCRTSAVLLVATAALACGAGSPSVIEGAAARAAKDGAHEPAPRARVGLCDAEGLCWEHPLPQGNDLSAISARADDDLFAVGISGTVLHFDGRAWSRVPGAARHHHFVAVWPAGPREAFVADASGGVGHVVGGRVRTETLDESSLRSISGSSRSDVYAASYSALYHYNGSAWSEVELPDGAAGELIGVYARDADDVWVAGRRGLVHFDGEAWSPVPLPDGLRSASVLTGTASGDVFVGGGHWTGASRQARVARFDGTRWSVVDVDVDSAPTRIAAMSDDVVVIAGQQVARSHGDVFRTLPGELPEPGYDVAASPSGPWIAGPGGDVRRLDDAYAPRTREFLNAVFGRSPTDVFAVGRAGTILHRDARGWTAQASGTDANLRAVWGEAANMYAVGERGTILRFDGSTWSAMTSGVDATLLSIVGRADDDVFAVGHGGTVLHFDGEAWSAEVLDGNERLTHVEVVDDRVFVLSEGAVRERVGDRWVVGNLHWYRDEMEAAARPIGMLRLPSGPAVVTRSAGVFVPPPDDADDDGGGAGDGHGGEDLTEGSFWEPLGSAMTSREDVFADGGEAWALRGLGALEHHDGRSFHWSAEVSANLAAVWASGEHVFAVGGGGAIVHLEARRRPVDPGGRYFTALAADDSTVYLAGLSGSLATIPPGRLSPHPLRTASVLALARDPDGSLLAVGAGGRVERIEPPRAQLLDGAHVLDLTGAWISEAGTRFTVGFDGYVLVERRGQAATRMRPAGRANLTGVAGLADDDVFVVGNDATVLRYDGTRFSALATPPSSASLADADAGRDGTVIGVGRGGVVLEREGGAWVPVDSGTDHDLHAVSVIDRTHAYAVGADGAFLAITDGRAHAIDTGVTEALTAVFAESPQNVLLVGDRGTVLHYDGDSMTALQEGYEYDPPGVAAAYSAGPDHGLVIHNTAALRRTEDGLSQTDSGHLQLFALAGRGEGVFAVGASGVVARYHDGDWEVVGEERLTMRALRSALVTDDGTLYVGGDGGALFRRDGERWTAIYVPSTESLRAMFALDGAPHALGSLGTLFRIGGDEVRAELPPFSPLLTAVAANAPGDAVVVGHRGTILEWDGRALHVAVSHTSAHLRAVWAAGGGRYVAVGDGGAILARVDGAWIPMEGPTTSTLSAVYGRSWSEIYAAGAENTVLRYDGARWALVASGEAR